MRHRLNKIAVPALLIVALTGLDFLTNVNDDIDEKDERIVQTNLWPTND